MDDTSLELQRAAVFGAGTSGRGVARVLANAGIEVLVVEKAPGSLDRAMAALRESMERDIGRWSLTEAERDAILARIEGVSEEEADLTEIQAVFECITEDIKEKRRLLFDLDQRAPEGSFFFLNTSTLSVTSLAESVSPPRRPLVLGLHFLHPVPRIPLVELVRGRESGRRAEEAARSLARRLGKEVVEVAEYPGYVTSRLTLCLINEAIHLVMEGVATRDVVDRSVKLRLGGSHGPLALADEIGLDSIHRALESLWKELGLPQFRPAPLLRRMVNEGWLGEKSGRGFYTYDETGRRIVDREDLSEPEVGRMLDTHPRTRDA